MFAVLVCLFAVSPEAAAGVDDDWIFWANYTPPRQIFRAHSDGSSQQAIADIPLGIALFVSVDRESQRVYFNWIEVNPDTGFVEAKLASANYDGTDLQILYGSAGIAGTTPEVWRIDADPINGYLFWTLRRVYAVPGPDTVQMQVLRSDLQGGNLVVLYDRTEVGAGNLPFFDGVSIDPWNQEIYFGEDINFDGDWTIRRTDLDFTTVEDVIDNANGAASYVGNVRVDGIHAKICWKTTSVPDAIWSANTDGTGVEVIVDSFDQIRSVNDIRFDTSRAKIWWTNNNGPDFRIIYRANLDGSEVEERIVASTHNLGGMDGAWENSGISVTAPAGGENWRWTNEQSITWRAEGLAGNVDIELSRTGLDGPWETLLADEPNDGAANWTVTGPGSSDCYVRVMDAIDAFPVGTSDGSFTIDVSATEVAPWLYWTDYDQIVRGTTDGTGEPDTLLSTFAIGIALDTAGGHMYWTNHDDSAQDAICRSDLEGVGTPDTLHTSDGFPWGIALDTEGGFIYWTDWLDGAIYRGSLDGTGEPELLHMSSDPRGIAVDPEGGFVYWTDTSHYAIYRGATDGSGGPEELPLPLLEAPDMELDAAAGFLYWTDPVEDWVIRGTLDGQGIPFPLFTSPAPDGLALDVPGGFIYWFDNAEGAIYRGASDGSGESQIIHAHQSLAGGARLAVGGQRYSNATPAGTSVVVDLGPLTDLTFDQVDTAGESQVILGQDMPEIPSGFLAAGSDPPIYFDITTTAVFSGQIEVCLGYDDGLVSDESTLRMLHYEEGVEEPVDVTTSLDTANNVLCGTVNSLSPFVIVEVDPTISVQDGVASPDVVISLRSSNPTTGSTTFRYGIPAASQVRLAIYDSEGRKVRTLEDATRGPGFHTAQWDGEGDRGQELPSGLYFYRFEADGVVRTGRVVMIE